MKKTISVTVDADIHLEAQRKLGNISEYINECLKGIVQDHTHKAKTDLTAELETLKHSKEEIVIKIITIENTLKELEAENMKKQRELEEQEQYKRWICPICKRENFMDESRCSKCNLPTRDDSKTETIMINER